MTSTLVEHGAPPVYLTFPSLTALGVPHAVTTRHCPGVTSPAEATGPFNGGAGGVLTAAGVGAERVAYARQVHGADVLHVREGGLAGTGDILVSAARGVPVAVFTADCLAITLYAPGRGLAVAHAGWRGSARGVASTAVAALSALGAPPETLRATIGPSIGPCCYEVDEPVRSAFRAYSGRWERWMTPVRSGHWMLDLWGANESQLCEAGVPETAIENPRLCTGCNPELLFSYRRGDRGRLVMVAALP